MRIAAEPLLAPPFRSSTFYHYERTGCAAVLAHEAAGAAQDMQMFAVGEVAHLCLLEASRTLAHDLSADLEAPLIAVAERCLSEMPPFDDQNKPPVGPRAVADGLRLALQWLKTNEPPTGNPETGLAVKKDLVTPTEYGGPEAYWQALVDHWHFYLDFDEDGDATEDFLVLRVTDYKTSWADTVPDTLQRRGQAILVAAHLPQLLRKRGWQDYRIGRLVLQTASLRRSKYFERVIEGEDEIQETLGRWRSSMAAFLEGAEQIEGSVEDLARTGPGCNRCPYLGRCGPAHRYLADWSGEPEKIEDAARAYSVSSEYVARLKVRIEAALESGPIDLGDDGIVEKGVVNSATLRPEAYSALWDRWRGENEITEEMVLGLLRSMKITAPNARAAAKSFSDKDRRKRWLAWLEKQIHRSTSPRGIKLVTRKVVP